MAVLSSASSGATNPTGTTTAGALKARAGSDDARPHDEAPGGNQGQSSSSSNSSNGTLALEDRRPLVWHTGARIFEVVAGSGRHRYVMLVRCPYCPDLHSLSAYELKPTFRRRAMCGLGYIVVHTHADQVAA